MGQDLVAIHVLPHVRKYLMVRLAPDERLADPTTQDLVNHMVRILDVHVLHAVPDPQLVTGPKSLLRLHCGAPVPVRINTTRTNRFNVMVEELYRRHSHTWMDWLHQTTHAPINTALDTWRSRYGITNEDQPFETARRAYARHREKIGLMLPRGGARFVTRHIQKL